MSDLYFSKVGTKAALRSKSTYTSDDAKPELLLDYYNEHQPMENNLLAIDKMYQEWCDLLFCELNVAVEARQSSFRLLETFSVRYLESKRIPDFQCLKPDNGTSILNITTVRMNGLSPISMEQFNNYIFGITTKSGKLTDQDIDSFLIKRTNTRSHYVFLIHNFESLYQECRDVCDIIFSLYARDPKHIHIILSTSHIFAAKILNELKTKLNLIFFRNPYSESFFYERAQSTVVETAGQSDRTLGADISLQSLRDIYEAIPVKAREFLIYLIGRFLERFDCKEEVAELQYDELFQFCQSKFILSRNAVLQNYLGELKDHRIIEMDPTGKKIRCLLSTSTCKKFLDFTSNNQEE